MALIPSLSNAVCDSDLTCVTIAGQIEYVCRSRCGLGVSSGREQYVLVVAWARVPHWSCWHSCDVMPEGLRNNCANNSNVVTRESPGNN